jgi:HAD superfamily hydrolase (TIGR01490 family)
MMVGDEKGCDEMKVALFDFDGTIYKKETFSLLMNHLKTFDKQRYQRFFMKIVPIYFGYKLKLVPERKMKGLLMERYARALHGFTEAEVDSYFGDIYQIMQGDLNQDVLGRMEQHRADGFLTLIVSGAFTPLLQQVAADYPVDTIIGTEIRGAGEFDHVHGERKVALVESYFRDKKVDWGASFAYGDSSTDLPILRLVGNPVAVCPDVKLRKQAVECGWKVLE